MQIHPHTQIIRVIRKQNDTTTLWVYIHYTASFCEHLKSKNIEYTKSETAMVEDGYDHGITFHKFVWHEITIKYTDDFAKLLSDWHIPPTGL